MSANFCIHCAERIVQEVDICILIHGSRKQRCQEKTLHTPWALSLNDDGIQQLQVHSRSPGKGLRPASHRPTWWVGSECSRTLGAVEEEGQDGNWNPIYLARLTRAFCPSLSGVPRSPISVRSFSFKSCKSYMEIEKEEKKKRSKMCSPPAILTF